MNGLAAINQKNVFLAPAMRKTLFYILISILLLPSCGGEGRYHTKVVKPRYHHWFFNRKKDKKAKRTRIVKMQS
jgi:hypothetical protein